LLNQAIGFKNVDAFSQGGNDTAYLYAPSTGSNSFVGYYAYAYVSGGGLLNQAIGFKVVNGYSSSGHDTASLSDSPGNDTFTGQGSTGTLAGPGYQLTVNQFAEVLASSTQGGTDTIHLGVVDYLFERFGNWQ
jgi:hypothetical protein